MVINKKRFFTIIFLSLFSVSLHAEAQSITDAIASYKKEATTMGSYEIYQEVEKSKETLRIKQHSSKSYIYEVGDRDLQKATGYMSVLEDRRKANDPAAAFYFGLHEAQICMTLSKNKQLAHGANKVCTDAIDSFKIAEKANDPRAMEALGTIYKKGLGVKASKYVAAEWFVKSAKQYSVENSRDSALSTLEEALILVPDHPGALRLRKELLK